MRSHGFLSKFNGNLLEWIRLAIIHYWFRYNIDFFVWLAMQWLVPLTNTCPKNVVPNVLNGSLSVKVIKCLLILLYSVTHNKTTWEQNTHKRGVHSGKHWYTVLRVLSYTAIWELWETVVVWFHELATRITYWNAILICIYWYQMDDDEFRCSYWRFGAIIKQISINFIWRYLIQHVIAR